MSDTFVNNLFRGETWSIATDFNHIAHPLESPNEAQMNREEPSFWDRFGGSVLFILMTPLIVPACLFLYWASKKVEQIDEADANSVMGRIDKFAETHVTFQHIAAQKNEEKEAAITSEERQVEETRTTATVTTPQSTADLQPRVTSKTAPTAKERDSQESTTVTPNKLLGSALLAFGPHRNKAAARDVIKALGAGSENLLSPDVRSFLLQEAILHDQVDKIDLLLSKPKSREEKKEAKERRKSDSIGGFNLSDPIPLHKAKSVAMVQKLASFGLDLSTPSTRKKTRHFILYQAFPLQKSSSSWESLSSKMLREIPPFIPVKNLRFSPFLPISSIKTSMSLTTTGSRPQLPC